MSDQGSRGAEWAFEPCRYGSSRLTFRGPPRPLDGRHIAFIGGSETIGKHIECPYPSILEGELGEVCVNLAQVNASIDAFLHDTLVPNVCRDALVTVVAVTGAANMSNRLYSVHPRRNDRFVKPSAQLRTLYPDVDFHEICFVRHLLCTLKEASQRNFEQVQQELKAAWAARMRMFLDRIGSNTILLWVTPQSDGSGHKEGVRDPLGSEPLFVTRSMVEGLRPLVRELVVVPAANEETIRLSSPQAHERVAKALLSPLRSALGRDNAAQRLRRL